MEAIIYSVNATMITQLELMGQITPAEAQARRKANDRWFLAIGIGYLIIGLLLAAGFALLPLFVLRIYGVI